MIVHIVDDVILSGVLQGFYGWNSGADEEL